MFLFIEVCTRLWIKRNVMRWKRTSGRICNCAHDSVDSCSKDQVKYNAVEDTYPKDLLDKLTKMYASKFLANTLFLRKDLYSLEMENMVHSPN